MMSIEQASEWAGGALVGAGQARRVSEVGIDTRAVNAGGMFVALKGARVDGNALLAVAKQSGASCALCLKGLPAEWLPSDFPRIEVDSVERALGQLAARWRASLELPLVAVAGSNGKTTATRMVSSIFEAEAPGAAWSTRGNQNNGIGVPLTLLGLRPHHRFAVVELGMNHPGEIEGLASMCAPTVALVNNAQREHQEFMKSVEAVAWENGAAISALGPRGVAVYPTDDPFGWVWSGLAGDRSRLVFSLSREDGPASAMSLVSARWDGARWSVAVQGGGVWLNFSLGAAGLHNVKNALAASCCALAAGVSPASVEEGLEAFEPEPGRFAAKRLVVAGRSVELVDDSYNANPDSVKAAIDALAEMSGPRLLVLGDMGEVGSEGPRFHKEVGAYAKERGIERLMCVGPLAWGAADVFGGEWFGSKEDLERSVREMAKEMGSIVVKGSRFMKMETVVAALESAWGPKGEKLDGASRAFEAMHVHGARERDC